MSLQSKFEVARNVLAKTKVDLDQFKTKLADFFGYASPDDLTDEDLESLSYESLKACGIPEGKAPLLARSWRTNEDKPQPQIVKIDISDDPERHAASLKPVELAEKYDPDNATNPYGRKLKEITEGRKCLVFNKDGSYNVALTKQLVQEIVDGYPDRQEITVDGIPLPTYPVGDRPDRLADENPFEHRSPLRADGTSDAGCNWGNVTKEVKQLVYIAVEISDPGLGGDIEQDVFDKVDGKDFAKIAGRYRKAAVEYHNREKVGTLPQLKVRLGGKTGVPVRVNNPFTTGHKAW